MSEVNGIKVIGTESAAVTLVHSAIIDILNAPVENETKQVALEVFGRLSRVENLNISDCNINLSQPKDND